MPKEYVVDGATIECNWGDSSSNLTVLPVHRVKLTDKYKANIGDCAPMVNVPPFGNCQSMANPTVAAATAANYGKLQPMPCTPACSAWIASKTDYKIDKMFPLLNTDKTTCPLGAGMIKITDSGQGDSKEGEEKVNVENIKIAKPERPPEMIRKPPATFGKPPAKSKALPNQGAGVMTNDDSSAISTVPGMMIMGGISQIAKATETVQHAVSSAQTAQSVLSGINPKFFNPASRFGGGFYVGTDGDTVVAELAAHGASATHSIRYNVDLSEQKMLDLTDPKVAAEWGFSSKQTSTADCQKIGEVARSQGYDVIKFQAYRGEGTNYAIFDNFNDILSPMMVTPIE